MRPVFTKTFFHFFFGFLIIIGAAFTVMAIAGNWAAPEDVDSIASPQ